MKRTIICRNLFYNITYESVKYPCMSKLNNHPENKKLHK